MSALFFFMWIIFKVFFEFDIASVLFCFVLVERHAGSQLHPLRWKPKS